MKILYMLPEANPTFAKSGGLAVWRVPCKRWSRTAAETPRHHANAAI